MYDIPNRLVHEVALSAGGWAGVMREWLCASFVGGKVIEIACIRCKASRLFTETEFRRTQAIEPCQCRAHADTVRQMPPAA